MYLTTREVAQLTGLSISALRHARSDRPDLNAPPCMRLPQFKGTRDSVRYDLEELILWMTEVKKCGGQRGAVIAAEIIENRIDEIENTGKDEN